MARFSPLFAGFSAGARSLEETDAKKRAQQERLEDRLAKKEEAERRRTLEDALEARRVESHGADMASGRLEDELTRARIDAATAPVPKAPVRGTPEYIDAIKGEAAARASATANTPTDQRKPAEFEKKAAFVLEGAEAAAKALDGYQAPAQNFIRKVPGLGNYGMSPEDQVAMQAAETLADAYLRLTTGATITPEEVKNAAQQMVPVPGDKPPVLAAKKARREQVIRAIRNAAQTAQSEVPAVPRAGGKTLTPEDAAKAKADPGFAAWLRSQGYEVP